MTQIDAPVRASGPTRRDLAIFGYCIRVAMCTIRLAVIAIPEFWKTTKRNIGDFMSQYQCLSIRNFALTLLLTIEWTEPSTGDSEASISDENDR